MNMALQRHIVVFLLLACLFTPSYSYQFTVGGKDGWVPNPSVSYNTWSQHMRFQINDSVLFKYNQGADSVLEVSKDDYDKCNTANPIKKMEDGNSVFTLDRSGPFYFISGNKDNCEKGQKLLVVVISVRNQGKPPSTAPPAPKTPAPGAAPPSGSTTPSPTGSPPSPPSGAPAASPPKGSSTPGTPLAPSANAPAAAPSTGSISPGTSSPNGAPTSTPAGNTPTVSPPAPGTGGSMAPAMSPVANGPTANVPASSAPAAGGPSGSMSPAGSLAPAAGGPSGSPLAPGAGGPAAGAPGGAAGPGGNTPADVNSPAGSPGNPNSFAIKAFTPSIVLVSAVSLVLTVALGELFYLR